MHILNNRAKFENCKHIYRIYIGYVNKPKDHHATMFLFCLGTLNHHETCLYDAFDFNFKK